MLRLSPVVSRVSRLELSGLGEEWNALLARSGAPVPFLAWAWVTAWLETLGSDADLEVLIARDPGDGRLVGVAPFFVEQRRRGGIPYRALRLLGSGIAAPDHLDLLVEKERGDVAEMLWRALQRGRRWHLVDLDGVAGGGHLVDLALRRRHDHSTHRDAIPCPYLPLRGEWEDVEQGFGRSHRSNIRRYARKMDTEAGAPVTIRLVAEPNEVSSTVAALGDLHQRVRTARGDKGAFATERLRDFHRTAAVAFAEAGRLRLHRLDVGTEMAAAIYCFRQADSVVFYTTGYDPRWARYGPGRRVMAAAIRSALEEGATEFDFLRGDESYKRAWGAEMRHDARIVRPASALGRLLWLGRSARSLLDREN